MSNLSSTIEPQPVDELPLLRTTPARWATLVLQQPLTLLNDHAHLERKAAQNALDLISHWPSSTVPKQWMRLLTAVARDEAQHLARVCRLLHTRGGSITNHHQSQYAANLRSLVRSGSGRQELLDRLLISSLIELRSCERFLLLSESCKEKDLRKLYGDLWLSERGHYLMFLELGESVVAADEVQIRWQELLKKEAEIIETVRGLGLHSWPDEP